MQHLLPSQLFQPAGIISQRRSSTISQAKPRSERRVVETDQVDENGVVKSRRRTSKHSVRAASIMGIVVDTVAEDAAVEDTEAEAIAEMANQDEDVVDIEDVATHRQQCSNCIMQASKATGRIELSLRCTKSFLRFAISGDADQKTTCLPLFG